MLFGKQRKKLAEILSLITTIVLPINAPLPTTIIVFDSSDLAGSFFTAADTPNLGHWSDSYENIEFNTWVNLIENHVKNHVRHQSDTNGTRQVIIIFNSSPHYWTLSHQCSTILNWIAPYRAFGKRIFVLFDSFATLVTLSKGGSSNSPQPNHRHKLSFIAICQIDRP